MASTPVPQPRPTTRTIAARAGISYSAVAKALRNHPRISKTTRERVLRIARELGYRPDPRVAQLMHHLRHRHKPDFTSVIAALTNLRPDDEKPYHRLMLAGARRRAEMLGHALTVFRFEPEAKRNTSLQRVLRSRGVEGLLVLPLSRATSLEPVLDWDQFSVVVANRTMLAPNFSRVIPHAFDNMLLLCRNLFRLGYRRVGLVINRLYNTHITHGFSAAVLWQQAEGALEPVQPLVHEGDRPAGLRRWFERERPDAIVVPGAVHAEAIADELGLPIPGPVGFVVATWEGSKKFAGIDPHPEEIGSTAIDLLHGQIRRGDRGTLRLSMELMITGTWVDGPSAPIVTAARTRRSGGKISPG